MGLRLHTHLSETTRYVDFCRERFNKLPVEFVADHEWLGPDVWFAHLVHLQASEIAMLAETGSGCSHCPVSNARFGSGIAPAPQMAAAGVPMSLAVDGVASNESGSMTNEAHFAWLVHRAAQGASATTVEETIHWGSAGGAGVLGLDAVGTLEAGKAADLVLYEVEPTREQAADPVLPGHQDPRRPGVMPVRVGQRRVVPGQRRAMPAVVVVSVPVLVQTACFGVRGHTRQLVQVLVQPFADRCRHGVLLVVLVTSSYHVRTL